MAFKFANKIIQSSQPDIDVAPMVDMMFILLIFFMVTSTFVLQPGFKIELPEAAVSDNTTSEYLTIYVSDKKEIFLNDKKFSVETIGNEIKKALPKLKEPTLSINADYKIEYGLVIKLTDIAKLSGIRNVILTTQPVDLQKKIINLNNIIK